MKQAADVHYDWPFEKISDLINQLPTDLTRPEPAVGVGPVRGEHLAIWGELKIDFVQCAL